MSDMRTVIGLYESWSQDSLVYPGSAGFELVHSIDVQPTRITVVRHDGRVQTKIIGRSTDKELLRGFASDAEKIGFHRMKGREYANSDFYLCISFEADNSYVSYTTPSDQFYTSNAVNLIKSLSQLARVEYGFCAELDGDQADYLLFGIIRDQLNKRSIKMVETLKYYANNQEYLDGIFYDICKINVINTSHFKHIIAGRSLQSWIDSSNFGQLISIGNDSWIWLLEDSSIKHVRECLSDIGAVALARY